MIKSILPILILFVVNGCASKDDGIEKIVIDTDYGDIEVELFADKAPKTVAAFHRKD